MKNLVRFFGVLLVGVSIGCSAQGTPSDPVDRVVARFGVSRQEVLTLAGELGVDPSNIGSFGDYYFPYNYYEYLFETFEQENGRPPKRSEIDRLIGGYVARCDEGEFEVIYIYYSTQTHPGFGEIAMVFRVVYSGPKANEAPTEDPVLSFSQPVELWDGSVNPRNETYWDRCVQAYRREE